MIFTSNGQQLKAIGQWPNILVRCTTTLLIALLLTLIFWSVANAQEQLLSAAEKNRKVRVLFPRRTDAYVFGDATENRKVTGVFLKQDPPFQVDVKLTPVGSYTVEIMFIIEPDGTVEDARVLQGSGSVAVDAACREMVIGSTYGEPLYNGHPIAYPATRKCTYKRES